MVARERLPVVRRSDVRVCGGGWSPRGVAVGACERLPVGQRHDKCSETWGSSRAVKLGDSERLPLLGPLEVIY